MIVTGSAAAGRSRGQRPGPVLVIEDSQPIRDLIVAELARAGHTVVAAANGAAALERVRELAPSAIVLDLNMPIMDGREFLAAYRALPGLSGPHAPVIVCEAGYRVEDAAEQLGAAACVPKPFDLDDLLDAVDRVAPAARAGRAPWAGGSSFPSSPRSRTSRSDAER